MPEHTCNLSAQEAEAGNQELRYQSGLHIDFGACHKQNNQNQNIRDGNILASLSLPVV